MLWPEAEAKPKLTASRLPDVFPLRAAVIMAWIIGTDSTVCSHARVLYGLDSATAMTRITMNEIVTSALADDIMRAVAEFDFDNQMLEEALQTLFQQHPECVSRRRI